MHVYNIKNLKIVHSIYTIHFSNSKHNVLYRYCKQKTLTQNHNDK